MKAKLSNLELLNFVVEQSAFKTTFIQGDSIEQVKKKLHKRIFSVDFDILEKSDHAEIFLIKLKINSFPKTKRKTSAYDFMIKITAKFILHGRKKLSESKEFQYILYSALPMTVSLARTEIAHLSANGIFGKYILPAIDMQSLIDEWIAKNNI